MEEVTQEQLTPEALDEQRSKLMEYYEKTNPFLKAQAEYESLITDIQESKTRRLIAQMQVAQLMAPQQEEEDPKDEAPIRKLRKED
jgi:hypothetical protein